MAKRNSREKGMLVKDLAPCHTEPTPGCALADAKELHGGKDLLGRCRLSQLGIRDELVKFLRNFRRSFIVP